MSRKRILVIDDEQDILLMVQLGLELADWEVLTASTPAQGLAQAASQHPDAILLDLTFPNADGRDVCRALKASAATREIPVLMVSGKAQSVSRDELRELGVAGVLEKPFDATLLSEQVASQLGWVL